MKSRVLLATGFAALLAAGFLVSSTAVSAQSLPLTLEGFSVRSSVTTPLYRMTLRLAAPYRAAAAGPFLIILDETLPASPVEVAKVAMPQGIWDMAYAPGKIYVACGVAGLVVVDVSNPLAPSPVGLFSSDEVRSVALNRTGEFAYVTAGNSTMRVLNLQDPTHPKFVTARTRANAAFSQFLVNEGVLLAAAGPKGVIVYNIEDPRAPVRIKSVKDYRAVRRIALDSNRLVAALDNDAGLVLISFPKWESPDVKAVFPLAAAGLDCAFLSGTRNLLAVAQGGAGFTLLDVTDPSAPVIGAQSPSPDPVVRVEGTGSTAALLSCGRSGLYSLGTTNPSAPAVSNLFTGGSSKGAMAVSGSWVYVAAGSLVEVWNYADSAHPVLAGSVPLPTPAVYLLAQGNLLLASCQSSGLLLFDLSSPAAPSLLSTVDVGDGAAAQAALSGNLVALSAGTAGLLLIDISVPTAPVQLSSWNKSDGFVSGAAFSSPTMVWVGQSSYGITSVDVSSPSAPVETGSLSYELSAGNLLADGNYLYAALSSSGLTVTDISNPAKPEKVSSIPYTRALKVVMEGSSLLLADGVAGLAEVDITDPTKPFVKAYFETPGQIVSAAFLPDGTRLAASGEGGLWAVEPYSCAGANLQLPCDGARVSSFAPPLFTWIPRDGAKYKVEISRKPTFPKDSLFVGKDAAELLKVPSFIPGGGFRKLLKWGRGGETLYWRVVYFEGSSKSESETRTFTLW